MPFTGVIVKDDVFSLDMPRRHIGRFPGYPTPRPFESARDFRGEDIALRPL